MEEKIRILITDNHRLFREGLRLILSQDKDFEVVGEAANAIQMMEVIAPLNPDVVLLDIKMPIMDGIKAIPTLKQESPGTKPLMLTAVSDEESIFNALKAGAKGYLSKDASSSDLVRAIKAVHQGEMWIEAKLISRFFDMEADAGFKKIDQNNASNELTNREKEILSRLAKGMTNKEIAEALFISDKTVKAHLNSIFRKLKVTRRYEAIIFAIQKGYV